MNIRSVLIALLSLVIFTIQPTYASQQGPGHPSRVDWKEKLGLSNEQIEKIKKIKDMSHDDMKEMRMKKWSLYKEMVVMSHNKTIDQNKLNTLISDMNTVSEKMMRQEIKMKHDIYMTLTPEQQTKMNKMLQSRLKQMEKLYGQ